MSSASQPESKTGPDPADEPAIQPADESYVSEFLSEKSPEFDVIRQAAKERATIPGPPGDAASPAVAGRASAGRTSASGIPWPWLMLAAAVAVAGLAVAWFGQTRLARDPAASTLASTPAEGTATIISRPAGAEVFIDGERRGVTPLRLSLPVGPYSLELRNGTATRTLTLTVEAATAVREVVDLEPSAALGRLEISSDVNGARVSVDGVPRGVTPLVLSDIQPGQHRITISRGDATVDRTVTVQPGATASVMAAVVPSGASGGWLTFQSPIEMQVIENGEVIGTTRAGRLMVPTGRHELELVAEPYGFRTTATAVVSVGATVNVPVQIPNGRLSINAVPWADIWLNGQPLGSTPLANLAVPLGDHEVIWRHPEFGERRQSVRVSASAPVRVGLDLTR